LSVPYALKAGDAATIGGLPIGFCVGGSDDECGRFRGHPRLC